jgi:hypothetical protein
MKTPSAVLKQLLLTLVPALLWLGAVHARSWVIQPYCVAEPQRCAPATLWDFDRISVGLEIGTGDEYSFYGQDLAGLLAVSVPTVWNIGLFAMGNVTPLTALALTGTELLCVHRSRRTRQRSSSLHIVLLRPHQLRSRIVHGAVFSVLEKTHSHGSAWTSRRQWNHSRVRNCLLSNHGRTSLFYGRTCRSASGIAGRLDCSLSSQTTDMLIQL